MCRLLRIHHEERRDPIPAEEEMEGGGFQAFRGPLRFRAAPHCGRRMGRPYPCFFPLATALALICLLPLASAGVNYHPDSNFKFSMCIAEMGPLAHQTQSPAVGFMRVPKPSEAHRDAQTPQCLLVVLANSANAARLMNARPEPTLTRAIARRCATSRLLVATPIK
jgi:hypothetical protein